MKQGIVGLENLAREVDRQRKSKRDFTVPSDLLRVTNYGANKNPVLNIDGIDDFEMNKVFHEQLANKTGIPKKYYDLMLEKAPDLLCKNANHWLIDEPEKKFVRTLDGQARAFLSGKYRPLDNSLIFEAAMVALQNTEMQIASSEITDRHFFLKVNFPSMTASIEKLASEIVKKYTHIHPPDYWTIETLQPGIVISNSEVGCGAVNIESLVYTIRCRNGAIFTGSLRKYHVGKGLGGDDESAMEYFTDATKKADDKAFIMKVHDIIKAACDPKVFQKNVEQIAIASTRLIDGDVQRTVEKVQEKFDLGVEDADSILNHLIKGGKLDQWGLSSAVTAHAQNVADYEKATDLERIGGKIIELSPNDWQSLVSEN